MVRPNDKSNYKSWVVNWKGNTPVLVQTAWAPGYTPGHQATEQEAIAAEVISLMQHISDFREKWLKINLMAEQKNHQIVADAFGSLLTVTETDDPHEQMIMPEDATSVDHGEWDKEQQRYEDGTKSGDVHQAEVHIPIVDRNDIEIIEGADIVEHMYEDWNATAPVDKEL